MLFDPELIGYASGVLQSFWEQQLISAFSNGPGVQVRAQSCEYAVIPFEVIADILK